MPKVNPDKGFALPPTKRRILEASSAIPANWFELLGTLITNDILHLDDERKSAFIHHLNRCAGETSTYSLKPRLHESLQTLYLVLADEKTPPDQKQALAVKIHEGAANCTAGFHDRCNECLESLHQPENLDEMLGMIRQSIVSMAASRTTDEVHAYNRFFILARNMGYGVRPLNLDDIYQGIIDDATIKEKLMRAFTARYTLFAVLNALIEQLQSLVKSRGYAGARETGYAYEDFCKFNNDFLKPFIGELTDDQLFVSKEDDDNMVPVVMDINWCEVKKALLRKVKDEAYFIFSAAESTLLTATIDHDGSAPFSAHADSLTLISSNDEWSHCLTFYSNWPEAIKAPIVAASLEPKLLTIAQAGNIDEVKALLAKGADVNAVLGILIAKHKDVVMNDPDLRDKITLAGFSSMIPNGIHAGKTVAEVWVNSKRGRYWLAEDVRLQALLPDTIAGKSKSEWLAQATTEKPTHYARWFAPESRLVKQLLQHVIYGEEQQAKDLLDTYPGVRDLLLTGTAKVTDYSNRQFKKLTAFQLALCAWDNEMCDMLKPYMSEEERTNQYQAIFPEGHETYVKSTEMQQAFDFTAILNAIASSNDADVRQALALQQPNDTALWRALEQFRQDVTARSQQERIFNPKHLLKAFELYDEKFNGWSWNQRDLFWRQVIGYIQRFLPANIAQDVAQGLYSCVEEKEKSRRSLHFRVGGGAIYPFLGFEYACACCVWDGRAMGGGLGCWVGREGAVFWKTYVEKKHETCRTYATPRADDRVCDLLR